MYVTTWDIEKYVPSIDKWFFVIKGGINEAYDAHIDLYFKLKEADPETEYRIVRYDILK